MTNNDENVVRTRLLLDGDGTGDDRRLNNISKMVRSVQQQKKFLNIKFIRKLNLIFFVMASTIALFTYGLCMSDMIKYRPVSFKKDQIAALYFTIYEKIVHN